MCEAGRKARASQAAGVRGEGAHAVAQAQLPWRGSNCAAALARAVGPRQVAPRPSGRALLRV
eukprot:3084304-Pleurochrysis_carterae.AAC.1